MVSPFPPWLSRGGVSRTVNEIANRLKKDFDISIYCVNNKSGIFMHNSIPVHVFKGSTGVYRFSPSLYVKLKKAKCDLIHSHSLATFAPLAASLVKRDRKLVFNPYFHNIGSTSINTLLRKLYDPIVGYYLFRRADLVVCFSNTEKLFIRNLFSVSSTKVRVIYNGANIYEITGVEPYDLHEKIILYVGRLEKYKNIELIIKSLQYLPKEYQLYLIGKGAYEVNLKMIVSRLNLKDRVKFFGYLMDREMYRWLKTCSVFVQLSKIESGISISCIEALAAGKPVIVNDSVSSLKETVDLFKGEGVFPFNIKTNSARELAELIEEARLLRVNMDLKDFDWDTTARKFKELYFELIDKS